MTDEPKITPPLKPALPAVFESLRNGESTPTTTGKPRGITPPLKPALPTVFEAILAGKPPPTTTRRITPPTTTQRITPPSKPALTPPGAGGPFEVITAIPPGPEDLPPSKSVPCFNGNGVVRLDNGRTKLVQHVVPGDKVLSVRLSDGSLTYQEVYLLSHYSPGIRKNFIRFTLADGRNTSVSVTPGHYMITKTRKLLHTNAHVGSGVAQKLSEHVAVGDELPVYDAISEELRYRQVSHVTSEASRGLYNPHTTDGVMLVDGVAVTSYTTLMSPTWAHATLWPARALWHLMSAWTPNDVKQYIATASLLLTQALV